MKKLIKIIVILFITLSMIGCIVHTNKFDSKDSTKVDSLVTNIL